MAEEKHPTFEIFMGPASLKKLLSGETVSYNWVHITLKEEALAGLKTEPPSHGEEGGTARKEEKKKNNWGQEGSA